MSAELPIVYAALILQDGNVDITAENLQSLVKAAGVKVSDSWCAIFAKALEGQDLADILSKLSTPGAGAAVSGGAAAAAADSGAAAAAEEAKEEEKEESDEDMGFGLFD